MKKKLRIYQTFNDKIIDLFKFIHPLFIIQNKQNAMQSMNTTAFETKKFWKRSKDPVGVRCNDLTF